MCVLKMQFLASMVQKLEPEKIHSDRPDWNYYLSAYTKKTQETINKWRRTIHGDCYITGMLAEPGIDCGWMKINWLQRNYPLCTAR